MIGDPYGYRGQPRQENCVNSLNLERLSNKIALLAFIVVYWMRSGMFYLGNCRIATW